MSAGALAPVPLLERPPALRMYSVRGSVCVCRAETDSLAYLTLTTQSHTLHCMHSTYIPFVARGEFETSYEFTRPSGPGVRADGTNN